MALHYFVGSSAKQHVIKGKTYIVAYTHSFCDCRKSKQDAVPTVAYSDGYSTLSYYPASACDQVYLHPKGDLSLTGTSQ